MNSILYIDDDLDLDLTTLLFEIDNRNKDIDVNFKDWTAKSVQLESYLEVLRTLDEVKPAILLLDNKLNFTKNNVDNEFVDGSQLIYFLRHYFQNTLIILVSSLELKDSFYYSTLIKKDINIEKIIEIILEYNLKEASIFELANEHAGEYKIAHEDIKDMEQKFKDAINGEIRLNRKDMKECITNFMESVEESISEGK